MQLKISAGVEHPKYTSLEMHCGTANFSLGRFGNANLKIAG